MATEEEAYIMSDEQLLDKTPISIAMHPNAEIMSTAEAMEQDESGDEEELDLHVCGKCKAEFTNIQHYVEHKRGACPKQTSLKSQESPSKGRKRSETPGKQVLSGTDNVTAILEPQVQSFCETVIEEGGIVVEAQDSEAHQEIIKAARASESQSLPAETACKDKEETTAGQLEPGEIDPTASTSSSGDGSAFKCNVCNKDFDRPESLVVHQFMHKKFHQCCDCKRSFVSAENLNKHKKDFKHVFKCKICQEEFASKDNCKSHAASHTRQHECQDCKKKFFTDKALERHRERVMHNLPCDKCDKICRDKHALTKHQESHLRVKSHVCDWEGCERGFRSASELLKHRKCVHLGIKEHKCAECGREFARKDKLNRHILIHSPNRPTFPCPFKTFTGCQKTFYRKDKLQRHIFAHSKEKPYKCETCQKVFARKDNLTEHMRIHTGEFKHRCPVCNKGMGGPKKLLLHVRQKHSGVNEVMPDKPTMVSESVLLATSVAATVVTSAPPTTTSTESADATAASWVQENITGQESAQNTGIEKAAASPASALGMSEQYQSEQEQRRIEQGADTMEEVDSTSEAHHHQPEVHHHQSEVHHRQSEVHHHQPEVHHHQSEVHHHQPEVHHRQSEVHHHQSEVHHHQSEVHHHQSEVHHHQSEVHHHQPEVHHQREAPDHQPEVHGLPQAETHHQPELHGHHQAESHHQPEVHHHHHQTAAADHHHQPEVQGHHHQVESHHQPEVQHHHQPEDHQANAHHSEQESSSQEMQQHQNMMEQEPPQDAPRVAVQPLVVDQPNQPQQNVPQQIILQPHTMIIPPAQGSPPRVSVHYLAPNTTPQARASYQPAVQQNVASVTQSDTALLHEVLNELATRSLFNS